LTDRRTAASIIGVRQNDAGFLEQRIGMPEAHKNAFLQVARDEKVVIIVRATGPTCHGLLAEGYDTKGYRIHGKSCDWGPMAGFVMRDPRLNKSGKGKEEFNRKKHKEALEDDEENQGWRASITALKISWARIHWLVENDYITVQAKGDRFDGVAAHDTGIRFNYSLIREAGGLFGAYFDNTRVRFEQEKGDDVIVRYHAKYRGGYEPMFAMTNPIGHRQFRHEHHMNAITGDYDLFAIWPFVRGSKKYDASAYGDDHRPLGTVKGSVGKAERANVDHLERNFADMGDGTLQGTKLGNITPRMYMICQLVNSIVGHQVLWHSDEAARPFLDDMDLPVIALAPSGNYFGIETIDDFKSFIRICELQGIYVTLSNAWAQDPDDKHAQRLGAEYARYVPEDGTRIVVPKWYNA
jgi:hypothetical protein